MSVRQLFHDTAFDPETVAALCSAFDLAKRSLHDKGQPAIVVEVIAQRLISFAEKGERDPAALASAALESVGLALD